MKRTGLTSMILGIVGGRKLRPITISEVKARVRGKRYAYGRYPNGARKSDAMVEATLSRLVSEGKVVRPSRGMYLAGEYDGKEPGCPSTP